MANHLLVGNIATLFIQNGITNPDDIRKRIEQLPKAVADLAQEESFKGVFEAQWKFHAFRDVLRFPLGKVDGPPYPTPEEQQQSLAADAAILEQRNVLLAEGLAAKNPGVFLHFFQDEVPHHGYVTAGGHWVLLPEEWEQTLRWKRGAAGEAIPEWTDFWSKSATYDKKGSMAAGSTTDWMSYRSEASNLDMIRETAAFMIDFMNKASGGRQKPVNNNPVQVARNVQAFLTDLRQANVGPVGLLSMEDVIRTKMLQAKHGKHELGTPEDEAKYGQQADGPRLPAAEKIFTAALKQLGAEAVPAFPLEHDEKKIWSFDLVRNSGSSGAAFVDTDGRHLLYADLRVRVSDVAVTNKTEVAPFQIEVRVNSVPSQNGEQPYVIDSKNTSAFGPLNGSVELLNFTTVPVGKVNIEVRYLDSKSGVKKAFDKTVTLTRRSTDETVTAPTTGSMRSSVADALQSLGLAVSFANSPNPDYAKPPLDEVTGTSGASKGASTDALIRVVATIEDDAAIAKKFGGQIQGDVEVGTEEKASVRTSRILLYPTQGLRYPKGKAQAAARCGLIMIDLSAIAESDRGFNQGENPAEFSKEQERLKPEALRLAKEWLLKVTKALSQFNACKAG